MLTTLGAIIGKVSDDRRLALVAAVLCGAVLGAVEYAVMEHLLVAIPDRYRSALDAAIIALGAAAFVWLLLAGNRDRRRRVRTELGGIAELNHEVRNALQVIAHSQYRAEPDCRAMVLTSVNRIDAALKRLSPLLGVADPSHSPGQRSPEKKQERER
jgi:hypothetical protein